MRRELVAARLSFDVVAAARAKAKADGQTLTEVVEQALVAHLGLGKSGGESPDLAARVSALEQRLSQIEAIGPNKPPATLKRGKRGRR
jgi:hypothetical protein